MVKRKQPPVWQIVAAFLQGHSRSLIGLLLMGIMATTILLGMQWLQDPYRFPLRVVKVDGDFRYLSRGRLQRAVAPHVEGGFFTVDVARVRAAVENLPWVYQATVQRIWPDRLEVRIKEQEPVARWGDAGFLNRYGEAFMPEDMPAGLALPALFGPGGHEHTVLEQYRQVAKTLMPLGLQLARIELDQRRAWHLEMHNGVQLELGRADIEKRLQRFVRTYPELFLDRLEELQRVDLRYSNGFSVYWQQAETGGDNTTASKAKG